MDRPGQPQQDVESLQKTRGSATLSLGGFDRQYVNLSGSDKSRPAALLMDSPSFVDGGRVALVLGAEASDGMEPEKALRTCFEKRVQAPMFVLTRLQRR
jgi:hypothetical protein